MSGSASEPGTGMERLEGAVERLLGRLEEERARSAAAESRVAELEGLLARFESGDHAPADMMDRLQLLEAENHDIRDRLARGVGAVDRLLGRVRFMEEAP